VTFSKTTKMTLASVAFAAFVAAQATPPADTRKFKNDQEQTEAIAANTEKNPTARIEKLDKWKADFPESDYGEARTGLYFSTYGELKKYSEQIQSAQELRKKLPNNLQLIQTIFQDYAQIKTPSQADMAAVTDVANLIINHPDDVFSNSNKPQGVTDPQWAETMKLKDPTIAYAKAQLDKVAEQQGPDAVIARLKADPTRVELNQWLGAQILKDAKDHPEKQSDAIFHYARAASYTGPGCLDPKARAQTRSFVDRAYNQYHGSMEGEDKLLAAAANQPLPDGYVIKSNVDVAKEKNAAEEADRAANPMLAAWKDTKGILTGDGGQAKFDSDIKDSELPKFTGKIVSMTPALRPKTVVVAVEKDGVADCTLTFTAALPGKMETGESLTFTGVAKSFTKDPYMLTLEVDKDKLEGWTGKNAPVRPPAKTTKKGS